MRLCENRYMYERGQLLRAHPVVAAVVVVPLAKATAAKATAAVLVVVAASVAAATPVSEIGDNFTSHDAVVKPSTFSWKWSNLQAAVITVLAAVIRVGDGVGDCRSL